MRCACARLAKLHTPCSRLEVSTAAACSTSASRQVAKRAADKDHIRRHTSQRLIQVVTQITPGPWSCNAAAALNGLHRSHEREGTMKTRILAAALGLAFSAGAFAQAGTVQRDVNQQERIEQGLKAGQLNTKEAPRLEREEVSV